MINLLSSYYVLQYANYIYVPPCIILHGICNYLKLYYCLWTCAGVCVCRCVFMRACKHIDTLCLWNRYYPSDTIHFFSLFVCFWIWSLTKWARLPVRPRGHSASVPGTLELQGCTHTMPCSGLGTKLRSLRSQA